MGTSSSSKPRVVAPTKPSPEVELESAWSIGCCHPRSTYATWDCTTERIAQRKADPIETFRVRFGRVSWQLRCRKDRGKRKERKPWENLKVLGSAEGELAGFNAVGKFDDVAVDCSTRLVCLRVVAVTLCVPLFVCGVDNAKLLGAGKFAEGSMRSWYWKRERPAEMLVTVWFQVAPICRCGIFDNAYYCIHRLYPSVVPAEAQLSSRYLLLDSKQFRERHKNIVIPRCILPHSGALSRRMWFRVEADTLKLVPRELKKSRLSASSPMWLPYWNCKVRWRSTLGGEKVVLNFGVLCCAVQSVYGRQGEVRVREWRGLEEF